MEDDPAGNRDRRLLAVAVLGLALFVVLLVVVVAGGPVPHFDVRVRDWAQAHPHRWALDACRYFTDVFAPPVEGLSLGIVAGALSLYRRSWRPLVVGGVTAWLLMAVVLTLKHAVGRPGPGESTDGLSFPSGHTAAALVCLGMIVLLATEHRTELRRPLLGAVGVITVLVAGALVYASYHWFSDVVASVPLGVALLALVAPFVTPRKE